MLAQLFEGLVFLVARTVEVEEHLQLVGARDHSGIGVELALAVR